jgi:hypothetical protein
MYCFQKLIADYPCPLKGAALLHPAPGKLLFYQIMTGNNSGRASINYKTINILERPSPATIHLPGLQDFPPCRDTWNA